MNRLGFVEPLQIISDESLRRALAHLAPSVGKRCTDTERAEREAQLAKSTAWMDSALKESTSEASCTPWILDCDTTIKLLYGHQDGAEISYNPRKPGRLILQSTVGRISAALTNDLNDLVVVF